MHSEFMAGAVIQSLILGGLAALHGPYAWWEFVGVALLLVAIDYVSHRRGGRDD